MFFLALGCVGSSSRHMGSSLQCTCSQVAACGLSLVAAWALEHVDSVVAVCWLSCSMWDPSSPTGDRTQAPSIGSVES